MPWWKYQKIPLLFLSLCLVFYGLFAYNLERSESIKLLSLYFVLMTLTYLMVKTSGANFKLLLVTSVLVRLVFLFAIPNLSQDFYRFIWDGQLIVSGLNPYLSTPDFLIASGSSLNIPNLNGLYQGMGELSASNYSNYPPINQLCFVIAVIVSGKKILGSIIFMRLIIIAADLGILYFGKKLLDALNLPKTRIFWYVLNPFIIIELTGNLHFEGVMLFFLVFSLYLLHLGKWKWAALLFGCSISVKLIPLMLLPLFFKFRFKPTKNSKSSFDYKRLISFYSIVGLTVLSTFLPFLSIEFINNYSESIGLWFGDFEFNASIYYVFREIGYLISGYNEIAIITKILSTITLISILSIALIRKNYSIPLLISSMLLSLSIYFFLSTTVHPWYISSLVLLCIFTRFKYPLVWSSLVVLSYVSYAYSDYKENLLLVFLVYFALYTFFIYELLQLNRKQKELVF